MVKLVLGREPDNGGRTSLSFCSEQASVHFQGLRVNFAWRNDLMKKPLTRGVASPFTWAIIRRHRDYRSSHVSCECRFPRTGSQTSNTLQQQAAITVDTFINPRCWIGNCLALGKALRSGRRIRLVHRGLTLSFIEDPLEHFC